MLTPPRVNVQTVDFLFNRSLYMFGKKKKKQQPVLTITWLAATRRNGWLGVSAPHTHPFCEYSRLLLLTTEWWLHKCKESNAVHLGVRNG